MKKNMGKADRIIRGIIGLILLTIALFYHTWWGAIGVIPLATALIGFCPMYVIFSIKSCRDC
jgi:hypothetical protein